jgi:hypothetical protein
MKLTVKSRRITCEKTYIPDHYTTPKIIRQYKSDKRMAALSTITIEN